MKKKVFTYDYLITTHQGILESLMKTGSVPDTKNLIGYEFRGVNVVFVLKIINDIGIGIEPKFFGVKKFKKGFVKRGGEVWGYNVKVKQNSIFEPHFAVPNEDKPNIFGWYKVYPAEYDPRHNIYRNSLLLNYGYSKELHPARFLRDYLVQVEPENIDLYLGKAYLSIGHKTITLGYFVLERYNKSSVN